MSERYRAGLDTLLGLGAEKAGLISDRLAAEAPGFVRLLIEFVFADILARPGLDRRTRLLIAIAVLAAQGNAPAQLRWFAHAALAGGAESGEIVETFMQVAAFSGFSAATSALEACADLLEDQTAAGCCCLPAIAAR